MEEQKFGKSVRGTKVQRLYDERDGLYDCIHVQSRKRKKFRNEFIVVEFFRIRLMGRNLTGGEGDA